MKISGHEKIHIYNARLQSLYGEVISWLKETNAPWMHLFEDHALAEEHVGNYVVKKMIIKQGDETLAQFIPVGILIIGAEGRVDLVGKSGKEILVYFSEGGPEMTTGMSVGDNVIAEHTVKIYGQKREGWHWIDDRITGKQPKFTKDIFLALLERIN